MKKEFWIILVVIILIGMVMGIFYFNKAQKTERPSDSVAEGGPILTPIELLKNATIKVPDSSATVILKNGAGSFKLSPDSGAFGDIRLLNDMSAEWSRGDRTDLAAVFAIDTGGTGLFYYLVLFDVSGNNLTKTSEVFLGDRIDVTQVGVGELVHGPDTDYRITVQILVRGENEPFSATPTIPQTRTFYVTDQILEEVIVGRDDS